VPRISTCINDVLTWNKWSTSYFEFFFAFANTNLYDDGILVFTHAVDLDVSRDIHNWAYTMNFYMAEDWFGMNDLDLQSPMVCTKVVSLSPSTLPQIHMHFVDS